MQVRTLPLCHLNRGWTKLGPGYGEQASQSYNQYGQNQSSVHQRSDSATVTIYKKGAQKLNPLPEMRMVVRLLTLSLDVALLAQIRDLGAVVALLIHGSGSLHEYQSEGILVAMCLVAGET